MAIIPEFTLTGLHNQGKNITTCPSRYFSFDDLKSEVDFITLKDFQGLEPQDLSQEVVNDRESVDLLKSKSSDLIIRRSNHKSGTFTITKNSNQVISDAFNRIQPLLKSSKEVRQLATSVLEELGDFDLVHVRRGDMLTIAREKWWLYPKLDYSTRPQGIRNRISPWIEVDRKLYIMSDERKPDFFLPLQSFYKVFMFTDFPILKELSNEDNYLLFSVEQYISSHSRVKVNMYSRGNNKNSRHIKANCYSLLDYPREGSSSLLAKFMTALDKVIRKVKRSIPLFKDQPKF